MSDIDDFEEYDEDDLECDCLEEEIDILTGYAHCHRCGSTRYLPSEEFTKRLQQEAEFQANYDQYVEKLEKTASSDGKAS